MARQILYRFGVHRRMNQIGDVGVPQLMRCHFKIQAIYHMAVIPGFFSKFRVPDSLVHRLCTGNAVYEIVKLHIGRMFFPQWVGTDTLHLLSVIQKFFYFFKSLCNSTSGTMPKTCYINLTITIHKK